MHARSALFDLWGDHIAARGGCAPISALVRLLAALGISEPAVRTAVSRMVRQGWLVPTRTPQGAAGYALTDRARTRLDDASRRIYRTTATARWGGHWHLVVLAPVGNRSGRDRTRAALRFLGYAPLHGDTWIAPRPAPDLAATLGAEGASAQCFDAVATDGTAPRTGADAHDLAAQVWDLEGLAAAYRRWQAQAHGWAEQAGPDADDEQQFAARSRLVHEWRKFLFTDPALPAELLPPGWPGHAAAELFDRESARLAPAAARFVDSCLQPDRELL
ncbi:MAG: PaaX family transcriptional regulator [Nocardioidaceae bacterium]|nr:PaaX family transcriptional regulator [Nocardioidaceae bacterium]